MSYIDEMIERRKADREARALLMPVLVGDRGMLDAGELARLTDLLLKATKATSYLVLPDGFEFEWKCGRNTKRMRREARRPPAPIRTIDLARELVMGRNGRPTHRYKLFDEGGRFARQGGRTVDRSSHPRKRHRTSTSWKNGRGGGR